jgi:hypothetical protein
VYENTPYGFFHLLVYKMNVDHARGQKQGFAFLARARLDDQRSEEQRKSGF